MDRPDESAGIPISRPSGRRITLAAVTFETGLLGVGVGLAWILGRLPLVAVKPSVAGLAFGILGTLPLVGLLLALRRSTLAPIVRLRTEVDRHLLPLFRDCGLWQIAAIAAAAGVGEEVLFRGLIQGLLTELGGPAAGLLGAGILFGLAHMITRTYAVLAALVGVYLGWLAIVGQGLWIPIVVHAIYDFVALSIWIRRPTAAAPTAIEEQA